MPDDLVRRIDEHAGRKGISRSAFLQAAARDALAGPSPAHIADAVALGREALAAASKGEARELIRRERDFRDAADRRR